MVAPWSLRNARDLSGRVGTGLLPGQVGRRESWWICFAISQGSRKKALIQKPLESILKLHIKNLLWEMRESEKQKHSDEAKVIVPRTFNSVSKGINVR